MKFLAICPNPNDITAFYRVLMPLLNLHREGHITYNIQQDANLVDILSSDIVLLQRPCLDSHLGIAERCKLYNKPLLVDYDDNLFEVPESNPAYFMYNKESTKEVMRKCIALADHVWVSTDPLKDALSPLNASISVIPNALDLSLMPARNVQWEARQTDIMWRGGSTHEADVASVTKAIVELSHKHTNWRWLFMGVDFRILEAMMAPKTYGYAGKFNEISVYYRNLLKLSAPIHIVPLEFNAFNESKSNLAWLEATWAGSAVVAPDMPEWSGLPLSWYGEDYTFTNRVEKLMNNPDLIKLNNQDSWELIQTDYLIEHTNKIRLNVLKNITRI